MLVRIGIDVIGEKVTEICDMIIQDGLDTTSNKMNNDISLDINVHDDNIYKTKYLEKLVGCHKDVAIEYINSLSQPMKHTLKFIGYGSWFNQAVPNTSAYIKRKNTMLLIDCGSTTYNQIVNNHIMDGVKELYIYITHNHDDHVGSLASLILRCQYLWNIRPYVMTLPKNVLHLRTILTRCGCDYVVHGIHDKNIIIDRNDYMTLRPFEVNHVEGLCCSALDIKLPGKRIIYTGDINSYIGDYVDESEYDEIYTDCSTGYKSSVHIHIDELDKIVIPQLRNKIFCMHINGTRKEVLERGFNCVDIK